LKELNEWKDAEGCNEDNENDPVWDKLNECNLIMADNIKTYDVQQKIYELRNELYALPF